MPANPEGLLPVEQRHREALAFLKGEAAFEGRWFGDRMPGVPAFWWRKPVLSKIEQALAQSEARIAELEEALRPFADACMISNRDDAEDIDDTLASTKITWGDLRRARAALSQVPSQEGK